MGKYLLLFAAFDFPRYIAKMVLWATATSWKYKRKLSFLWMKWWGIKFYVSCSMDSEWLIKDHHISGGSCFYHVTKHSTKNEAVGKQNAIQNECSGKRVICGYHKVIRCVWERDWHSRNQKQATDKLAREKENDNEQNVWGWKNECLIIQIICHRLIYQRQA